MYQKWRVFARMQTEEDFETLMGGLMCKFFLIIDELKLRNSISQHQEYLRMGIRTLKEANEYEKHKVAKVL
jgi:transcriptional adapter 2-alpha